MEAQSLGVELTEFGDEELSGARQLIEKIILWEIHRHIGMGGDQIVATLEVRRLVS